MRLSCSACFAVLLISTHAGATDLAKIPRSIGKEPMYESKAPRYCLIVIGPEAKARVWLVLDGDVAYLDRNGNGDLTDDDKIKLPAFDEVKGGFIAAQRQHDAGAITAWPTRPLKLMLMQSRVRPGYKPDSPEQQGMVKLFGEPPGGIVTGLIMSDEAKGDDKADKMPMNAQVAMVDGHGSLRFSERPAEAPIVHFHGPLTMSLQPLQRLIHGQETELKAWVGTPGLGGGTFAAILYFGRIPEEVHPVAEVEFPAGAGKAPLRTKVTLSKRC